MDICLKLTRIIYILLLACFVYAETPDRFPSRFTSVAELDNLSDKSAVACLFTDTICNDIEEAEKAEENEYKRLKIKKQKNIWLPQQLTVFTLSLYSRHGFKHKKSRSAFIPVKHNCELQSVILLL